jgi:hypothetical protein
VVKNDGDMAPDFLQNLCDSTCQLQLLQLVVDFGNGGEDGGGSLCTVWETSGDGVGAYALYKAHWTLPGLGRVRNQCRSGLEVGVGDYFEQSVPRSTW